MNTTIFVIVKVLIRFNMPAEREGEIEKNLTDIENIFALCIIFRLSLLVPLNLSKVFF